MLHEMNVHVGGRWRFDMKAPNGTVYPNRIEYLEIVPNERLVFDHGEDIDNDPKRFRVTITFNRAAADGLWQEGSVRRAGAC